MVLACLYGYETQTFYNVLHKPRNTLHHSIIEIPLITTNKLYWNKYNIDNFDLPYGYIVCIKKRPKLVTMSVVRNENRLSRTQWFKNGFILICILMKATNGFFCDWD